ncbi:unnamed protein product [Rotaria sordida]|uniref:Uncharacterized protein n=1 Tax=Rotaria sordida TaxID=392033 RepID=A0A814W8Z3_9BILA|nr:unnamed protein product [Rotaria sordida]CAF1469960.1 unnamed protein product [Rotaria sordida]
MNARFYAYLKIRDHKTQLSKQHLAAFNNTTYLTIDNCQSVLLVTYRDYIEKLQVIEFPQDLTTIRTHLTASFLQLS